MIEDNTKILLNNMAEEMLYKFRNEDVVWSDFKNYIVGWSLCEIDEMLQSHFRDIADYPEEMQDWKINYAPEIDDSIFKHLVQGNLRLDIEILRKINTEFLGEDIPTYVEVPINIGEKTLGWCIVEQHGPLLDPEYDIVQIFYKVDDLREWWSKNFP